VIVLMVILLIILNHKNANAISSACTSSEAGAILQTAATDFSPSKTTQLSDVVNSIEQLPNYQKDPNCLYVITMYNVYADNESGAQTYLSEFNKIYKNEPLSTYLTHFASVATLREYVATLSTQTKEIEQRSVGVSS
jgi:hypothetical protein